MRDLQRRMQALTGWRRWLIVALLGGVAALGQAPWGLWPLSVVALAVVYGFFRQTHSSRQSILTGWVAGSGYFAVALCWIVSPFMVYPEQDGWMAPFALVFMAAGMGLFWAAGLALAGRCWDRGAGFIAGLGLAEWVRGWLFTGFPWAQPGHVLIDTPLLGWASVGGALALTLLVLVAAVALWHLLTGPRGAAVATWAGLAACFLSAPLLSTRALTHPDVAHSEGPVIRLVQPNAPQHEKWDPDRIGTFFRRQLSYTAEDPKPDLIVWPETAIPYLLDAADEALAAMTEAAGGVPLVFGANRWTGEGMFNTLAVLTDGAPGAVYAKHHLVPFGEYVPFADLLGRFGIYGMAARDGSGYAPGPGPEIIDIPGIGRALPLICYEAVFSRNVRDAPERPDVLLLITNDAWFGSLSGPYQHLAQARLRAVEMGLPMIRVANTGVSAMIDARGQITAALPLGQAGRLDATLAPAHAPTLFATFGSAPVIGLLFAVFVFGLRRDRRRVE